MAFIDDLKKKAQDYFANNFATISVPQPTPTQSPKNVLPSILQTAKNLANFAKGVLIEAPARAASSLELEALGQKQLTPQTAAEKWVFGNEPIYSIGERIKQAMPVGESLGQKVAGKVGGEIGKGLAPVVVLGMTALDLAPFGGTKKTLETALLKTKTAEEAASLLSKAKVPQDLIDIYAPKFAQATKIEEVKNGLKSLENILKSTKPEVSAGVKLMPPEGIKEVKPETKITPEVLQQKARETLQRETPIVKGVSPTIPSVEPLKIPTSPSLESLPPDDPVRKLVSFYNDMEKARAKTESLYSAERAKRAAKIAEAGQRLSGEEAFYAQLAAAKGELPKANIAQLKQYFSQQDVDELFNRIEASNLMPYQKMSAKYELAKAFRGVSPTKSGLELLQQVFPKEFVETLKVPKHTSLIGEIVNLPRTLMASTDFSAGLRQGIFMVGRPKEFLPAFISQFKYAASEKAYQGLMEDIVRDPLYPLAEKLKLALTDIDASTLTKEERYVASNLAEHIPGLGHVVRASDRAYTGFLNKLRWDTFKDLYNQFKGLGYSAEELEEKIMPAAVRIINAGTGRGGLPNKLAPAGPVVSGVFFAPRLVSSRLTLLWPGTYINLPAPVRQWAVGTLLRSTAIVGTLMTLFAAAGWKVGTNLLSADFGKVKKGNTRIDLTGGFGSYIRLGAQLWSGKMISSTTGKEIRVGEGYKPLTELQILGRFAESKEAPVLSFITDLMRGENAVGEKITLPRAVVERFIPMVLSDVYDLLKTQNLSPTEKVVAGTAGVFGAGLQTYGEPELVQGVNPVGQPTIEVQPKSGLAEDISTFLFGQQPLVKSQTSDVQAFYNQLKQMPSEQANQVFNQIKKQNPKLAQQIMEQRKNEILGVTPDDLSVKSLPIEDGSRAHEIVTRLNKLSTNTEKDKLWRDYERKGIITPTVARQLYYLLGIKR